jgi:hypothetical protein
MIFTNYLDSVLGKGHLFGNAHACPPLADHAVCVYCGLSTVYLQTWPQNCEKQQKEKATMKIKLQIGNELTPEPVQLLNVGIHRTASEAGFDEVTLFTTVNGQEVNLVGVRVSPDGLVATRWNSCYAGDGIVSKDLTGRIKDLWSKQS